VVLVADTSQTTVETGIERATIKKIIVVLAEFQWQR